MTCHLVPMSGWGARRVFATIAWSCALLLGCEKTSSGPIAVDGSSTVYPISKAVSEQFERATATQVSVQVSGTGGGFRKFCAGELDIANASRPINAAEVDQCKKAGVDYVEVPVGYDALTILVNPKNSWASDITVSELKRIWEPEAQGKISKWSDVRDGWPAQDLRLFGAGKDSGTYDYFTEAIIGDVRSRADYSASENDDKLVEGVANDELALGFFGYAYYLKNKSRLKVLPVDDGRRENGAGPIAPSVASVRAAQYQPLARPIFIYIARKSLERAEVTEFVTFYLERGRRTVDHVGYISLPGNAYGLGLERVSARRKGSMFGGKGSQVGLTIEQLLNKDWNMER